MRKFSYTSEGDLKTCSTKCPLKEKIMIGSWLCTDCEHFLAKNNVTKIVICGCTELLVCPHCRSQYLSVESYDECIKECNCDHDWKYTIYDINDDGIELERSCNICDKFEEQDIKANDVNQDIMKSLWKDD